MLSSVVGLMMSPVFDELAALDAGLGRFAALFVGGFLGGAAKILVDSVAVEAGTVSFLGGRPRFFFTGEGLASAGIGSDSAVVAAECPARTIGNLIVEHGITADVLSDSEQ